MTARGDVGDRSTPATEKQPDTDIERGAGGIDEDLPHEPPASGGQQH